MVDKLWRAENLAGGVRNKRQVDQRRADALETLICQSAGTSTSTGTGTSTSTSTSTSKGDQVDPHSGSTPNDSTPTNDTAAVPTPDHTLPTAQAPLPPPPNHTQLLVIANLDLLSQQLGAGTLEDGTPLPIDTIARLACDAEIIPAIFGAKGQPLWLGRRTRLATSAQRLAVTARDLGCIVCHASPEFCQVHHITWWSAGGGTDLDNLCIVCSRHHTMIHEQGLTIAKTSDGMKVQPPPARAFRMVTQPPDGTGDPPLDTQQPNRSQQPDTRQPDTRQRPGPPQRLSRQSPGGPPRDATAA
ncbi:HNH endonuclease signature motif containing protein [Candidatus Microthrix parvicella]|uniref:HNH endonuclease signature motif containing protein n=1 Tax=Candidatus Neomicrothrix parvicella TaxID=41950 RepID=UPI00035F6B28|nr:HNH endonuclease signature motif containing protein [Candidatus Microthrix parvicella]